MCILVTWTLVSWLRLGYYYKVRGKTWGEKLGSMTIWALIATVVLSIHMYYIIGVYRADLPV